MAAIVVTSFPTIGSSTVYSDTVRIDSSVNPIVTTIVHPASTVETTVSGGGTDPYTIVTSGSTTVTLARVAFIYITSTVIPGDTITSTVGYTTNLITSSGRIAVATVPILVTLTISNGAVLSIALPSSTASSSTVSSPSRSSTTLITSATKSTDASTTLNTSTSESRPLSSSTVGGIVVGSVLGILIVTILLFCMVRRNRRRRAAKQSRLPPTVAYHNRHELAGDQPPQDANHWLPGVFRTRVKPELEANVTQVAELEHDDRNAAAIHNRLSEPMSNSIYEAPNPSDTASTAASHTPLIIPPSFQSQPPIADAQPQQPIRNSNALNQQPQVYQPTPHLQAASESDAPKYFVTGPVSSPTRHSNPIAQQERNQLWQQSRFSESYIPPDSLSQLRAEHEALMERIKVVERRERERRGEV